MNGAILFRVMLFFLFLLAIMLILILSADIMFGTKIMKMLKKFFLGRKDDEADDYLDIEEARLRTRKNITDKANQRRKQWKKDGLY